MRPDHVTGPLVFSLLAGPIFASPLLIGLTATTGADLAGAAFVLMLATLFGFVIALIPNFVGSGLMGWAGHRSIAARHPLAWAAAGFASAWLIGTGVTHDPSQGINLWLGGVGLVCALISRRFADWPDTVEPSSSLNDSIERTVS